MTSEQRLVFIKISLFYGLVFLIVGAFTPFFPQLLAAKGFDEQQIGVVLGISILVRVISAPICGFIIDRWQRVRLPLAIMGYGLAITFASLAFFDSFYAVVFMTLLISAIFAPVIPVTEAIGTAAAARYTLDYGKMRLWGSIAFLVASTTAGILIQSFAMTGLITWLIVCSLAIVIGSYSLPKIQEATEQNHTVNIKDTLKLLKSSRFLLAICAFSFIQASHATYYSFSTVHWESIGFSNTFIGLLWSLGVLAEIILFLFASSLTSKFGIIGLGLIGAIAANIRWVILAEDPGYTLLIITQLGHALTFGATQLGLILFMQKEVDIKLGTTAQTIYSALSGGIFMASGTATAGLLYRYDSSYAYWLMVLMSSVAIILLLKLQQSAKKNEQKTTSTNPS